jgi:hypothetical protein
MIANVTYSGPGDAPCLHYGFYNHNIALDNDNPTHGNDGVTFIVLPGQHCQLCDVELKTYVLPWEKIVSQVLQTGNKFQVHTLILPGESE